jgi:hypothetical protein
MVNGARVWGLLDTGAARNIISEKLLSETGGGVNLDAQESGGIRVGNGAILHITKWVLLKVEFAGVSVLHKFAVVPNITIPLVIGNEVLRPHCGRLTYSTEGKPLVELEYKTCALCRANQRTALQTESDAFVLPESIKLSEQEKYEKVCTQLGTRAMGVDPTASHALELIVRKNLGAFAENDDDIGCAKVPPHRINLKSDFTPHNTPMRALNPIKREFLEEEVQRLLALGIIEPAPAGDCPFSSAVVIVDKKGGKYRLCLDFRPVNSQTIADQYPLPDIHDLLHRLAGKQYFACFDLLNGYFQVLMEPGDRNKTAFVTPRGLFMFNRMPFGLCGAPARFQRSMEQVFHEHV